MKDSYHQIKDIEECYYTAPSKEGYFDPKQSHENISNETLYLLTINTKEFSGHFIPIPTNFVCRKILMNLRTQYKALKITDGYMSGNVIKVLKPGTVHYSDKKWLITTPCIVQVEFEFESVRQDFFEEKFLEISSFLVQIETIKNELKQLSVMIENNNSTEQMTNTITTKHNELIIENKSVKKDIDEIKEQIKSIDSICKSIYTKIIDSKSNKKDTNKIYLGDD